MVTIMFDIETIDDLVATFGGPSRLGGILGIGDTAVHNWIARNYIPPSWHMRLYVDLRRMGKTADPELFELAHDHAPLLYPDLEPVAA
jgi:hypothetical protein